MTKLRWYHLLILFAILATGAFLRFHHLDSESLWLDEYWSVYVATGRDQPDNGLMQIPSGIVLDPPPAMGFDNAPPLWRVWTSVASAGNWPPIYGMVLRTWIDLCGPSDFSTRSLSALLSLASILLFFQILRHQQGPLPALLGAGLMSLAVFSVSFARETRPYSLITFLSLAITWTVFAIKRDGPALWRLVLFALLAFSLVLTHYFTLGPLLGIALFTFWRLPTKPRRRILVTLFIAALFTAAVWAPTFIKLLPRMNYMSSWLKAPPATIADHEPMSLLMTPTRLLTGTLRDIVNEKLSPLGTSATIAIDILLFTPLALIAYVWPVTYRKTPRDDILYWWLWTIASIGLVLVVDDAQHYRALSYPRFPYIAFPGICALVSAFAASAGKSRAITVTALVAFFLLILRGPPYTDGVPPRRPWNQAAEKIQSIVNPTDILVFENYGQELWPVLGYCVYSHYAPQSHNPILLPPPDATTLQTLTTDPRPIWCVGHDPQIYMPQHFPAWQITNLKPLAGDLSIWQIKPPQ